MTDITCNIQLAYSNRFKSNVCDQLYCNRNIQCVPVLYIWC